MKKINNQKVSLDLYKETLACGLQVSYLIKKGFNKKYVILGTNYGSNDHDFIMDGKEYRTPRGIAHFLEHKLFEQPDFTDAFMTLTNMGASSNAFTTNNRTCYLFSTTEELNPPLKVLLNFVFTPFFDAKRVEDEKGIIASEINMYKDYYDYQLQIEVLKNMYHNSTLSEDIAGEVEDIMQITKETLDANYEAFYQPSNMELCIIGDFNHLELSEYINNILKDYKFKNHQIERLDNISNSSILNQEVITYNNIIMEKFCLGIKLSVKDETPQMRLKTELAAEAINSIIFSKSSKCYQDLLDLELVNDSYGSFIDIGSNYRYILIEGMTNNPHEVGNHLIKVIKNISKYQITTEELEIYKKKTLGELLISQNSLETITNNYLAFSLLGLQYFESLTLIEELNINDLKKVIAEITYENVVLGIMKKTQKCE